MRLIYILVCLMLVGSVAAVDVVVVNSKSWQDMYLGAIYAGQQDADIVFFSDLGDAQVKTQTLDSDLQMEVYESARPVVPNFKRLLDVNDFNNYEYITYGYFGDLQEIVFQDASTYMIFDARFGTEALAGAALAVENDYGVLFLNDRSKESVEQLTLRTQENILAGYLPVRLYENIDAELLVRSPRENTADLSSRAAEQIQSEWGVLTSADNVDLESIAQGLPVVVYDGDLSATIEQVEESGILRFEVVGASMADIATAIRGAIDGDLRFILKYGRTVTGVSGLQGQILDLDSVFFDFPNPSVSVKEVIHYSNMDILAVTYENIGNIETRLLSTVEFGDNALGDQYPHEIPAGATLTVPYLISAEADETALVSGFYGIADQLDINIESEGLPFVQLDVQEESLREVFTLEFGEAFLDKDQGVVYVDMLNNEPNAVYTTLSLVYNASGDDHIIVSEPFLISGQQRINVSVPYLENADLLNKEVLLRAYYGSQDTILTQEQSVLIQEYKTDQYLYYYIGGGVVLLLIIILIIVVLIRKR